MKVKRIVANIEAPDPGKAAAFYRDLLGLEVIMDMGFIVTFGSDEVARVQLSVLSEGGSGTRVPDLSIEVDDLDALLVRLDAAGLTPEYGPAREPWGVRRVFLRDPLGRLVNILQHVG